MTVGFAVIGIACLIGYIGIAIDMRRHRRERDEFWMMWR